MANISLFDPMSEQINRFFHNVMPRDRLFDPLSGGDLKIDLSEDAQKYIVRADLPGVKKEDIKVEIDDNRVGITAHTASVKEERKGETVIHSERYEGKVYRSFTVDCAIDQAHAEAIYKDGVLELKLPKRSGGNQRSIKIN